MLRWKSFRYYCTFVFIFVLFVLPWRDVLPQLQCIYPYIIMILELNPKRLVSYGMLLPDLKSNWSIANYHHTFTFLFFSARHSCHRCVYLMVVVIFFVVAYTITFFIIKYLRLSFLIVFWWLGKFCDHVIFRSIYKAFPRRKFHMSIGWNINRASFLLFLSYPFESFFCRMIVTSTKCELCLNRVCSFAISTRTWATVKI